MKLMVPSMPQLSNFCNGKWKKEINLRKSGSLQSGSFKCLFFCLFKVIKGFWSPIDCFYMQFWDCLGPIWQNAYKEESTWHLVYKLNMSLKLSDPTHDLRTKVPRQIIILKNSLALYLPEKINYRLDWWSANCCRTSLEGALHSTREVRVHRAGAT